MTRMSAAVAACAALTALLLSFFVDPATSFPTVRIARPLRRPAPLTMADNAPTGTAKGFGSEIPKPKIITPSRGSQHLQLEKFLMMYTCKICGGRNAQMVSKVAYNYGMVVSSCKHCKNKHLIADNEGAAGHDCCFSLSRPSSHVSGFCLFFSHRLLLSTLPQASWTCPSTARRSRTTCGARARSSRSSPSHRRCAPSMPARYVSPVNRSSQHPLSPRSCPPGKFLAGPGGQLLGGSRRRPHPRTEGTAVTTPCPPRHPQTQHNSALQNVSRADVIHPPHRAPSCAGRGAAPCGRHHRRPPAAPAGAGAKPGPRGRGRGRARLLAETVRRPAHPALVVGSG